MGVPVRNVSHGKIAVCHRSLKVRMRLAAHDEGLRRVAPECVTTMAHAVCAEEIDDIRNWLLSIYLPE